MRFKWKLNRGVEIPQGRRGAFRTGGAASTKAHSCWGDTLVLGNKEAGVCATRQEVERPETRRVVGAQGAGLYDVMGATEGF